MLQSYRVALIQAGFPKTKTELKFRFVLAIYFAALTFPVLFADAIHLTITRYICILAGGRIYLMCFLYKDEGIYLNVIGQELVSNYYGKLIQTKVTRFLDVIAVVMLISVLGLGVLAVMNEVYIQSVLAKSETPLAGVFLGGVIGITVLICIFTANGYASRYAEGIAYRVRNCETESGKQEIVKEFLRMSFTVIEFIGVMLAIFT